MKTLIAIPVYNEQKRLAQSMDKLLHYLATTGLDYQVIIAENGSTDETLEIANAIAARCPRVSAFHLEAAGRGRALKKAWALGQSDLLAYMDVDLSTDLHCLPPLIESLGSFDLAVGSRLLEGSVTTRGFKREAISRGYNFLIKSLFHTHFSDAQCGFKALTRKAASELLPLVEDNNWFMDSELLILAETLGYRILDMPVRWVDDADSRVSIWRTVCQDLRGLLRLRRSLRRGIGPPQREALPATPRLYGARPRNAPASKQIAR